MLKLMTMPDSYQPPGAETAAIELERFQVEGLLESYRLAIRNERALVAQRDAEIDAVMARYAGQITQVAAYLQETQTALKGWAQCHPAEWGEILKGDHNPFRGDAAPPA